MWMLSMLPEDQHNDASLKYVYACETGWTALDFYNLGEPYHLHHKDMVGVDPNKEFNFLPDVEGSAA